MSVKKAKKTNKHLHAGKKLGAVKPLKKGKQEYMEIKINEVLVSNY